ncbi:MAG: rRNA maturation RNase YbeY [Bacteriovorax sp.]|nr:rRNA maturation RNase YbeY [Bacteriovorax sp.]
MKLTITLYDSGIKKNSSKVAKLESNKISGLIPSLEKSFVLFLAKNRQFTGVKQVSISMTLCGKKKIQGLNQKYRQKDKATDVLSFPIFSNLRPDKLRSEKNPPYLELGDIVICKEIAKSQAREFDITYEQEIIHLGVHGFLHLLGFDHEISGKEEKIMEKYESELVAKIYKKLKANQ